MHTNVFIQPLDLAPNQGLREAKERSQKVVVSHLAMAGEILVLGPFPTTLVPGEQGRAQLAPQRGAQIQTSRLKDQI